MANSKRMLNPGEICDFCDKLSILIAGGVSVLDSMLIMGESGEAPRLTRLYDELAKSLGQGTALSAAIADCGRFPQYVCSLIGIGEASGRLDTVLSSLARYCEKTAALRSSIRSAVTYPVVMVVMMLAVIIVVLKEVLPVFRQVLDQLGAGVGSFASGLTDTGSVISIVVIVLGAVILALVAAYLILRLFPGGRRLLARLGDSFFATRGITDMTSAFRFAYSMSLLLTSGLEIGEAIDMSGRMLESPRARKKAEKLSREMAAGAAWSDALIACGIFSPVYAGMVSIGARAGAADAALMQIARRYEQAADERISRAVGIIEPTLVALLSIMVGAILLSVMLPLTGIMAAL